MRYTPIAPIGMFDLVEDIPNAFILAHLWEHRKYREWYTGRDWDLVIVDNGIYEGAMVSEDMLHQIGCKMAQHADRVFVVGPEQMYSAEGTLRLFREYRDWNTQPYEDMIVLQAQQPSELVEFCMTVEDEDLADAFAIPIWMYRKGWCRAGLVEYIEKWLDRPFYWHALGLDNVMELIELKEVVQSVDTSMPFTAGVNGILLSRSFVIKKSGRIKRVNLLGEQFTDEQRELTIANLEFLLELIRDD